MPPQQEKQFELFIKKIVSSFRSKKEPSEQDIDDVFKKLKEKAKTATRLTYLDIVGNYSKRAYSYVPSINENKKRHAWNKHHEVDKAIQKRHGELITIEKKFGAEVKFAGAGLGIKTSERKQPPR